MEKKDLKTIERELKEMKIYLMAMAQIQKSILIEIKYLRRKDGNTEWNRPRKNTKRKSN